MLEINALHKSYGNQKVLHNFNLNVPENTLLNISGPSGCGKTTLIRCIAGLEKFDKGEIILNNKIIQSEKFFVEPNKRKIGMVFQDLALFPHLTTFQNINFVSKTIYKNKKERYHWNNQLLKNFRINHKRNSYSSELSGGEQQRVAIARALANIPELLLLDEPFSQLDKSLISDIIRDLEKIIVDNKILTILVSHNLELYEFRNLRTKNIQLISRV